MHEIGSITITPEILNLIAEIDEFNGRSTAMRIGDHLARVWARGQEPPGIRASAKNPIDPAA